MSEKTDKREKVLKEMLDRQHEKEIEDKRNYPVVMHNDIIMRNRYRIERNAGKSLTVPQQKLLSFLLSLIKESDTELRTQTFTVREFCEVCGLDYRSGKHYQSIKDAVQSLAEKTMWLDVDGDREQIVHWVSDASITKGSGLISIQLDRKLTPYLLGLASGNFTKYPLHDVIRMKSRYSIPLYQLLRANAFKGTLFQLTIEDLREYLDCNSKSYENAASLKAKVLEPAVNEINSYTELRVRFELRKTGKKYTHVDFYVYNLRLSDNHEDHQLADARYQNVEDELLDVPFTVVGNISDEAVEALLKEISPPEEESEQQEKVIDGQYDLFENSVPF